MTDKELFDWIVAMKGADEPSRLQCRREMAIDMCAYEGNAGGQATPYSTQGFDLLRVDINPDSPNFRSTLPRLPALVQKAAVATEPTTIDVQASPPARNPGPMSAQQAQIDEDFANELMDCTGFSQKWADANFHRSVLGYHGIGLSMQASTRNLNMDGQQMQVPSWSLTAFDFNAIKLVLDPGVQERNLSRHDFVMLEDAWTIHKARRLLGPLLDALKINIDENTLRPMGSLNSFEQQLNNITFGRLFSHVRSYSKTPGLMVTQIHRKDETGRFGTMEIVIELQKGQYILVNPNDRESPFGGDGLPLRLLHGHRRADTRYSIGDVRMALADQQKIDRLQTWQDRRDLHGARFKYVVDQNSVPWIKSDGELKKWATNAEAGILKWNSGPVDRKALPPHLLQFPPQDNTIGDRIARAEEAMRGQVHRAPINFGELKSHVTNEASTLARDESGQVMDGRVFGDKTTAEELITTMCGTGKKLVQRGDPNILGYLTRKGFDEEDLGMLASDNPVYQRSTYTIRDGSIRIRSWQAKKEDIQSAVQLQILDARSARRELATTLDAPLLADDRACFSAFSKIVGSLLLGDKPFAPMPLMSRAADFLERLEMALLDPIAMRDPAARQRVEQAIQMQRMLTQQMAQEDAAAQQSPQQTQPQAQEQPTPEGAFSELVNQLSAQQPAAAA